MSQWTEIGHMDDIPRLGARVVRTSKGDIAIFRNADDEIFAIEDRCPHRGGPLSQGIVHGRRVTCPMHDWAIELSDGKAVAPDVGCAEHYSVTVKDGVISLHLEADAAPGLEAVPA